MAAGGGDDGCSAVPRNAPGGRAVAIDSGSRGAPSALDAILRRDRWVTVGGIFVVATLSWAYLVSLTRMEVGDLGPRLAAWSRVEFALMFLMWTVMMVAMMLPAASPMILLHQGMSRRQDNGGDGALGTAAFATGYLLVWTGFSAVATLLQWGLERLALLSPTMVATGPLVGAGLVLAAGAYQMGPLKDRCLAHCRSPVQFLMQHWRRGKRGAFAMGLEHGAYCIGCCWLLMALLFVVGVMNLAWIAALAGLVLIEKVLPGGRLVARASGVGFLAAGAFMLYRAL